MSGPGIYACWFCDKNQNWSNAWFVWGKSQTHALRRFYGKVKLAGHQPQGAMAEWRNP